MAIKKDGAKQKNKPASGKTEESPKTKRVRKATSPNQEGETDFPIVGIGSSAGGLEALQELFTHMPADTGMGFVVVSYLDPSHVSMLPEILKKEVSRLGNQNTARFKSHSDARHHSKALANQCQPGSE